MAWVDAETVTSLIEAHGAPRESILRPRYERRARLASPDADDALDAFAALAANQMPDELLADLAATA